MWEMGNEKWDVRSRPLILLPWCFARLCILHPSPTWPAPFLFHKRLFSFSPVLSKPVGRKKWMPPVGEGCNMQSRAKHRGSKINGLVATYLQIGATNSQKLELTASCGWRPAVLQAACCPRIPLSAPITSHPSNSDSHQEERPYCWRVLYLYSICLMWKKISRRDQEEWKRERTSHQRVSEKPKV